MSGSASASKRNPILAVAGIAAAVIIIAGAVLYFAYFHRWGADAELIDGCYLEFANQFEDQADERALRSACGCAWKYLQEDFKADETGSAEQDQFVEFMKSKDQDKRITADLLNTYNAFFGHVDACISDQS